MDRSGRRSPQELARIDAVRFKSSDLQNHVVDEYAGGRINRRQFTRSALAFGFSFPFVGAVLAACANDDSPGRGSAGANAPAAGGLLRVGITAPGRELDPLLLGSPGSLALTTQVCEYLTVSGGDPELKPMLAESWSPNEDASVWTFKIRQGVTFNDGTLMTAEDVAASFNRIADPEKGSNALESLSGVLSPGGARAVDETTVVFELDGPNGSWPWLASSDNTSALILPKNYDGGFESNWTGTGPWRIDEYLTDVRATFVRNEDYWGPKAKADRVEFTLFEDPSAMVLGLQARRVSAISGFSMASGRAVLEGGGGFQVNSVSSSAHNPWTLRTDRGPLADKRIRRALALALDRPQLVDGLLAGYADVGNDTPFAPLHAATPDFAQRSRDIQEAKRLMAEAGLADGVDIDVSVWDTAANPEFAQLAQEWAKEVGIRVNINVLDTSTFLGTGEFGSSPQLDAESAIGDWGSRGVPNTFLTAQLKSDGVRNAAHWKSPEFDQMLNNFEAEPDVQAQQAIATQMHELLHDETPIIYPYFTNYLTASQQGVDGVVPTPMGHFFVDQATVAEA